MKLGFGDSAPFQPRSWVIKADSQLNGFLEDFFQHADDLVEVVGPYMPGGRLRPGRGNKKSMTQKVIPPKTAIFLADARHIAGEGVGKSLPDGIYATPVIAAGGWLEIRGR